MIFQTREFCPSIGTLRIQMLALRGGGERNPHQDSRRQNCRGNFWLPGRILLCENGAFHSVLPLRSLKIPVYGLSCRTQDWLQSGYMKKRKMVISWIQLYPAYNHFRNLKIPSRFLNFQPVKFAKHRAFASPKVSPIDCINEGGLQIP